MDLISILLVAIGLSMDCVAVSIATGLTLGKVRAGQAVRMGALFGGFQAFMPVLGWLLGSALIALISGFDHWVAFGVLAIVGGKMIYEGLKGDGREGKENPLGLLTLLTLAVATSIDALAVGLSYSLLGIEIAVPALVIGLVCFSLSTAAALASGRLGARFGGRMKLIGGSILILIGLRILIEHLLG